MSLKDCIRAAQQRGDITLDEAQALYQKYDAIARNVLSTPAARAQLIAMLDAEALERKRRALLTETRRQELEADLLGFVNRQGEADPGLALKFLLEHHGQARFQDVEHKRLAIMAQAHTDLEALLHEFRKGAITGDLRRRRGETAARLENVVRELFGEGTGDQRASQLASAWSNVAEQLRQRFNAAGGAIGKLAKWGLPQIHDQAAVIAAGKTEWLRVIEPLLDPTAMRHPLTKQPMTAAELRQSLDHIYDTIVTDGWNTRDPSGAAGGNAMFRRHADHRFLVFKDASSWIEYQRAFGEGDPFAAMMGYISTMSRDIAAMEVLGPNPASMLTWARQLVEKADPTGSSRDLHRVDDMWAHISGTANMPVGTRVANTAAGARNLISAATLGSATISALTDLGFGLAARMFNGLPVISVLNGYIRQFTTENTREAVRAGLILDSAVHAMHQQARYLGSISGRTLTGYINDRVLTYSGLQAWTQAGKHAFGLALQGELAEHRLRPMPDLPPALRQMLERHGFDDAAWDQLRHAPLYQPQSGATFIRPAEVARSMGQDLADRYVSMILRETRFAVPEATAASRSAMISTNQPGTLIGEVVRSAGQFKSFGVAVMMLTTGRMAWETAGGRGARGAAYGVTLLVTSTILGALAIQLKEIVGGRDPRNMDITDKTGAKFWGAAMLQGGGMGIYGDFLFADVNRFGGSLAGTVGGPMIDRLDNIRRLTVGNVIEFGQGQERTNFGREAAAFMRQNMPGSSLWFARAAWERVLMDQLQHQVDPDAHTAFRRRVNSRRRDFGNEFFWAPGQVAPARPPDLTRALGNRR